MKTLSRIFIFLVLIGMISCQGKEFSLTFDLAPDVDTSYRLLYYSSERNGGRWVESAAPIHLGKFAIECQTINPTIVYIYRTNNQNPESFIYARRGDKITITGEGTLPAAWSVRGNKLTERLSDWQRANLNAIISGKPEEINKAVASYVEKNKNSEIDPYLLLLWFNRSENPELFVRLWNMMDEKLRLSDALRNIPSSDIISPAPLIFDDKGHLSLAPASELFPVIPVRTPGKGNDTLRPVSKGRRASLLFFWHLGDPDRHAFLDSLKRIASDQKEDSVTLLIADINLDSDSLRWKNSLPFDSLSGVTRGWWPTGISTPEAIRLGISDYRTFVVIDNKGKVVYKGPDVSTAIRETTKRIKKSKNR